MYAYNINKCNAFKWIVVFLFLLISVSCSEKNVESEPCAITVDSVSIIDSMRMPDTTYYLVYRISGWSDKTEILELYNTKPSFDHCSRSDVEPVFGDSLEMSKTITHVFLNDKDRTLDIVYKNGKPDKTHNVNLKLEIR